MEKQVLFVTFSPDKPPSSKELKPPSQKDSPVFWRLKSELDESY